MRVLDRLLDASVVFAFDRTGYARHRRVFVEADLDVDLRGRRIAITGVTSGLGLAASRALYRLGASLFLLGRDRERGGAVRRELEDSGGAGSARFVVCDLADLASVSAAAAELSGEVDVLVHNAGVLLDAWTRTADGLEATWATNVVGPFALTHALLPGLRATSDARVITVTSGGLYGVELAVEEALRASDPTPPRRFDGVQQYAQTKRAELVLSDEWANREPRIAFHAMHPGWADTPGVERSLPRFWRLTRPILRSPEEGADTIVWLAAAPRSRIEPPAGPGGGFWFDRAPAPRHWFRRTRAGDAQADGLFRVVAQQARADVSG